MMVHDIEIAQEIVQEAFTRVWAASTTPSPETEFRRYLYRTITNLARDYHRHRARQYRVAVEMPTVLDPLDDVERRASDEAMRGAMRELTMRERQAIYLRYFEDQSFAETARVMGAPQVTVRVIVHRALAKLRRRLTTNSVTDKVAI
jgi:RNA polymerase sigma factor (sigma-70 family)